jgi:6-phosphogluconolactonase
MDGTNSLTAFIGCFASQGGRAVVQAAVDPRTGALSAAGTIETVPDSSYLAVGHRERGPVLSCVSETARGASPASTPQGRSARPLGEPVPP